MGGGGGGVGTARAPLEKPQTNRWPGGGGKARYAAVWTFSLRRRWCPSASHPPVPSLSLPGPSSPPYAPFLFLGRLCQRSQQSQRRTWGGGGGDWGVQGVEGQARVTGAYWWLWGAGAQRACAGIGSDKFAVTEETNYLPKE